LQDDISGSALEGATDVVVWRGLHGDNTKGPSD
jgi:hypothetical protein